MTARSSSRVTGLALVLFAIEAAIFGLFTLATHGYFGPMNPPGSSDFLSFYAAGVLANDGRAVLVYDQTRHWAIERLVFGDARVPYYYFFYPPVFLLPCAALARLPFLAAFALFQGLTIALYAAVLRRIAGNWRIPLLCLTFTAVPFVIGLGQNSFLTAALLGLGLVLLERRPLAAGLMFGLLCYKPQLAIVIPIALLAAGEGRALLGMAASALALVGLSLLAFGVEPWHGFLATIPRARETFADGVIPFSGQVSLFAAARLLGCGTILAGIVQSCGVVLAIVATILIWRRAATPATRGLVLVAAMLATTPVILFYDLLPVTIALAMLAREARQTGYLPRERVVCALLWIIPGLVIASGETLHLPLGPLAPALLLALGLRRHLLTRSRQNDVDATGRPVLNAGLP